MGLHSRRSTRGAASLPSAARSRLCADKTTNTSSAAWALVGSDALVRAVIPNGTNIPQGGHFLLANNAPGGYSLADYGGPSAAAADANYSTDIPDGGGVALFQTANAA